MRRGLGFHARHSPGGAFSPLSLFTGGVQGAWYDPSDSTTLFSDRAGTTPCGTPGGGSVVPVGLMLDKSQGLVLGPELVDTANTASAWIPYGTNTVTQDGDAVQVSYVSNAQGAYILLTQAGGLNQDPVVGTFYQFTFEAKVNTGSVDFIVTQNFNDVNRTLFTVTSTGFVKYSLIWRPIAGGGAFLRPENMQAGEVFWIRNISVKEIAGNHAIAANDTTARPELRARVNLLTYSEQFDNAVWQIATIGSTNPVRTANQGIAPDGTNTADRIDFGAITNATDTSRLFQSFTSVATAYVGSVYLKAFSASDVGKKIFVWLFDTAGRDTQTVTLTDSWQRISSTSTLTAGTSFITLQTAGSSVVAGGGAQAATSALVWGAQLTATNEFPANTYQRIVDANTYDAVGFPRYFVANGTSSAMSTPGNITLGVANLTQFIGLRKQADGSFPVITQFGGTRAIELYPSQSAGTNGYTGIIYTTGSSAPYVGGATPNNAAPVSNVLTVSADASQTVFSNALQMRVNGVSQTLSALNSGVYVGGTFGSAPLRIGARDTTSLFFNGNIYSIIVVGSAVSAGQISATEQWVAGKVGITI